MGSMELMDATQLLPNTISNLAARTVSKYNLLSHIKPFFNTVITNVAGPQVPLYQAGSKLMRFFGTGICWDSVGLFHIIFSYNGSLTISATCCRDMMPDPAFYASCLKGSFNELKKAIDKAAIKQQSTPASIAEIKAVEINTKTPKNDHNTDNKQESIAEEKTKKEKKKKKKKKETKKPQHNT